MKTLTTTAAPSGEQRYQRVVSRVHVLVVELEANIAELRALVDALRAQEERDAGDQEVERSH